PTRVAAAETARLVRAIGDMNAPLTGIIINQITTPAGDEISTKIAAREADAVAVITNSAANTPVARVTRGGSIRGNLALGALGAQLIGTPTTTSARRVA
ncbi:MAG: hypothetical protein AAF235_12365, partial [Planctomycetota bacterium]